ncbi:hypothetical protein ANO11243_024490 [Dothideomycetidae sp. 11243]|nr:hypothetical protein ANO11243_024490 [fungal sp. No.11243]
MLPRCPQCPLVSSLKDSAYTPRAYEQSDSDTFAKLAGLTLEPWSGGDGRGDDGGDAEPNGDNDIDAYGANGDDMVMEVVILMAVVVTGPVMKKQMVLVREEDGTRTG